MYSWELVGRSVTLSGIGFGFAQMMSRRRIFRECREGLPVLHPWVLWLER